MKTFFILSLLTAFSCGQLNKNKTAQQTDAAEIKQLDLTDTTKVRKVVKTEAEWRKLLSAEVYNVTREEGTERAFSGKYYDHHVKGTYTCACCDSPLFSSETKFESGTGWPSFYSPINPSCVTNVVDSQYGMTRTENECTVCGAHLGHVFDDGPKPTGLRYCINSASLKFVKS